MDLQLQTWCYRGFPNSHTDTWPHLKRSPADKCPLNAGPLSQRWDEDTKTVERIQEEASELQKVLREYQVKQLSKKKKKTSNARLIYEECWKKKFFLDTQSYLLRSCEAVQCVVALQMVIATIISLIGSYIPPTFPRRDNGRVDV